MRDRAFSLVFGAREFTAHVLGDRRLYMFFVGALFVAVRHSGALAQHQTRNDNKLVLTEHHRREPSRHQRKADGCKTVKNAMRLR